MTYTKMINKDGKTVSPTSEAFQAAAANADWNSLPGYGVILTDQPGAESWPITAATFILIHKQPQDPAAAGEALKFFAWAYAKGAKMAEELDYVPMPADCRRRRQEDLGQRNQGRGRQAAVRELNAIDPRKAPSAPSSTLRTVAAGRLWCATPA